MDFREHVDPTAAISSILRTYPFSIGLLRELLQNSDDAKASKQIFVLDLRTCESPSSNNKRSETLGPALLASNDALFSDEDWIALRSLHQSSKRTDTSKIGKYGIGFRSCYHITDHPHILSGSSLAILDPQLDLYPSGGAKFELSDTKQCLARELVGFGWFIPEEQQRHSFPGTIMRFPLRRTPSRISDKVVEPAEIKTLLANFIEDELGIALLFLSSVSSIEIHEIDEEGQRCLAKVSIERQIASAVTDTGLDGEFSTLLCTVIVESKLNGTVKAAWRILNGSFTQEQAADILAQRSSNAPVVLAKQKLLPRVAVALPIKNTPISAENSGRLFTYLPLPLKTAFPIHLHSLFALTQARQNLCNGGEVGIVKGSVDDILIGWNVSLFEVFIPKTWAALLATFISLDNPADIFRAWPPVQPRVECGDSWYWQDLPFQLLKEVVEHDLAVWVSIEYPQVRDFFKLSSMVVAVPDEDQNICRLLSSVGLTVMKPPQYILDLLIASGVEFVLLSPDVAHKKIIASKVDCLDETSRRLLLSYLLSEGHLANIIGLPITPLMNGKFTALATSTYADTHTLWDEEDAVAFEGLDESAIPLYHLPSDVAQLFREASQDVINVRPLAAQRVVQYLDLLKYWPPSSVKQLSSFWIWCSHWEQRTELYPLIRTKLLLPTRSGSLASCASGVFMAVIDGGISARVLELIQVPLLHSEFPSSATAFLQDNGAIKTLHNMRDVLAMTSLQPENRFKDYDASELLKYFADHLLESSRRFGPLSEAHQRTLRSLSIFPLLVPETNIVNVLRTQQRGRILEGSKVVGIDSLIPVLPIVTNTIYVDMSQLASHLMPYIHSESRILSNLDVLTFAFEHFVEQPKHIQCAFLQYMVDHCKSIPPSFLNHLRQISFVPTGSSNKPPAAIVDPECSLATIFSPDDGWIPTRLSQDDILIVSCLRRLNLLNNSLTTDIVQERIHHISNLPGASKLAENLLNLIISQHFDCSQLAINDEKWLPTDQGMCSALECFDVESHRPELFDNVFPTLKIKISASLRAALKWNAPIPLSIVKNQLSLVIRRPDAYKKLKVIVKELAQRVEDEADFEDIRSRTLDKAWVPISSVCVSPTSHAVFSARRGMPQFFQIPPSLNDAKTRKFLTRMGCLERPSSDVLLAELESLTKQSPTIDTIQQALLILAELPEQLTAGQRERILIPDDSGRMHPLSKVVYNNVGSRAHIFDRGMNVLAHKNMEERLATKLRVKFLGLYDLSVHDDDEDMVERLPDRIRGVLKQYSSQQVLSEFFANAADAGATEFGIAVDENTAPCSELLSPSMEKFQKSPALVIYNNGVFKDNDFKGIRRIGKGGKEGSADTIGQFGLGALSAFHFTEMMMVVSGSKVLFMDPSKTHLPMDRASLLLPLETVMRAYPNHLKLFDGLCGFHLSSQLDFFPGTIFRLALRNKTHASDSSILNVAIAPEHVWKNVVVSFMDGAASLLLFTNVNIITSTHRPATQAQWLRGSSVSADRSSPQRIGNYTVWATETQGKLDTGRSFERQNWQMVSLAFSRSKIPDKLQRLVDTYRIRDPVKIVLAACSDPNKVKHQLFSTLPLPISTSLPVQLSGSFILAPDRRNIRFDNYDNPESQYNKWLLSSIVPDVYLFFLEHELQRQGYNKLWWPSDNNSDHITNIVTEALYDTHIPTSERRICLSFYSTYTMAPKDTVVLSKDTKSFAEVLKVLAPQQIFEQPSCVSRKVSKVIDPEFIRNQILENPSRIISAFEEGQLKVEEIQQVVYFILGIGDSKSTGQSLVGLPLLPLANGTLATFETRSSDGIVYAWKPSQHASETSVDIFPKSCLVNSDFFTDELLKHDLNISPLDAPAIRRLVEIRIPAMDEKDNVSASDARWIISFWNEYPGFRVSSDCISSFPLVRTTRPGYYVSLKKCHTATVLLVTSDEESWLCEAMNRMGAAVVRPKQTPSSLRDILRELPDFRFEDALRYFQTIESSFAQRFSRLDKTTKEAFADWARYHMAGWRIPHNSSLLSVAQKWPIWRSFQVHRDVAVKSAVQLASDSTMLPQAVPHEVAERFLNTAFTDYSATLCALKVEPMSYTRFRSLLQLPRVLSRTDRDIYRKLLEILISQPEDSSDMLVPDSRWTLVKCSTLYARKQPFLATFSERPEKFVEASLRAHESQLSRFGLINDLTFDSFKACAMAIHEDTLRLNYGNNSPFVERALEIFRCYSQQLPLHISADAADQWRQLDHWRFIPRGGAWRSQTLIDSNRARAFPDIVAPKDILRPEFEQIAWTQRASFLEQPHNRVLVANPALGVPSVDEVVEHLRSLALFVAPKNPRNPRVLSDLKATYQWLNERKDAAEETILRYHDDEMFLNVDDPESAEWTWRCADELLFNIIDSSTKYGVRAFLAPYEALLLAAGVDVIRNPPLPEEALSSGDLQLTSLRTGFKRMRQAGKLADVVFVSADGSFQGHRALLAAVSEHFYDQFCEGFGEARAASEEDPVTIDISDFSAAAVGGTLDYIYTGVAPSVLALDVLQDILRLTHLWRLGELNRAAQRQLVGLVSIDTYKDLRELAETFEAETLLNGCQYFEEQNVGALRRLGMA